jgi:hypothetical protein
MGSSSQPPKEQVLSFRPFRKRICLGSTVSTYVIPVHVAAASRGANCTQSRYMFHIPRLANSAVADSGEPQKRKNCFVLPERPATSGRQVSPEKQSHPWHGRRDLWGQPQDTPGVIIKFTMSRTSDQQDALDRERLLTAVGISLI